jgi:hypothetical protein
MALQTIAFRIEDQQAAPKTERRVQMRYPSQQDMNCRPAVSLSRSELGTTWLGKVLDISLTGIGFSTSRPFAPGTVLLIELSSDPDGSPLCVPARVVHTAPKRKMRWIIGCEFTSPLSPEELQIILAQ